MEDAGEVLEGHRVCTYSAVGQWGATEGFFIKGVTADWPFSLPVGPDLTRCHVQFSLGVSQTTQGPAWTFVHSHFHMGASRSLS